MLFTYAFNPKHIRALTSIRYHPSVSDGSLEEKDKYETIVVARKVLSSKAEHLVEGASSSTHHHIPELHRLGRQRLTSVRIMPGRRNFEGLLDLKQAEQVP